MRKAITIAALVLIFLSGFTGGSVTAYIYLGDKLSAAQSETDQVLQIARAFKRQSQGSQTSFSYTCLPTGRGSELRCTVTR